MQSSHFVSSAFPPTVRKALGLLAVGWISLLAFIYHIHVTFPGTINSNNAIRVTLVGLGICYFVYKIKPWARSLCIFFNLGIIGINGLFLFIRISSLGLSSFALSFHALMNCLFFALCTYYLLAKPTAAFYKEHALTSRKDHATEDR
jgi:hypothetical protein